VESFNKIETKENSSRALFDKQFSEQWEQQKLEIEGERVRYIDMVPESVTSETPVLFVPGWGRTAYSYKDLLYELYQDGRRIISVEYPRWSSGNQSEDLPAQQRKAEVLLLFIKQRHSSGVDVLAHSEGGINTILAAEKEGALFRNFVLVDSGGYAAMSFTELLRNRIKNILPQGANSSNFHKTPETGREEVVDYSGDFFKSDEAVSLAKKRKKDVMKDVLYASQNPVRITSEAIGSLRVEIPEKLQMLKEQGHEISLIHGVNDAVVPITDVMENVDSKMITGVYTVRGGHSDMALYPETYGIVAKTAIQALEQKSLKMNANNDSSK
jgi:pimeloyl-ACP methyl ester carboxylesterase